MFLWNSEVSGPSWLCHQKHALKSEFKLGDLEDPEVQFRTIVLCLNCDKKLYITLYVCQPLILNFLSLQ